MNQRIFLVYFTGPWQKQIIIQRRRVQKSYYDKDLEVAGFDKYCEEALTYKSQYDSRLTTLMDHYEVKNEADIISGNIASLLNFVGSNKKKEDIRETIFASLKALKNEARGSLKVIGILTKNLRRNLPFLHEHSN